MVLPTVPQVGVVVASEVDLPDLPTDAGDDSQGGKVPYPQQAGRPAPPQFGLVPRGGKPPEAYHIYQQGRYPSIPQQDFLVHSTPPTPPHAMSFPQTPEREAELDLPLLPTDGTVGTVVGQGQESGIELPQGKEGSQ